MEEDKINIKDLSEKIFESLFDEGDLKEMRQRGFIAQELGFKLSALAAIELELDSALPPYYKIKGE